MDRLIILAAGVGKRLRPLTEGLPKCCVPLHETPLIEWQVKAARDAGIKEIIVVGGYRHDAIRLKEVTFVVNPHFETTNMVASLFCAESLFRDHFLVSYGDILYTPSVLRTLMGSRNEISVIVDLEWRSYWEKRFENILEDAESLQMNARGEITNIGRRVTRLEEIQAQYIGLTAFQGEAISVLRNLPRNGKIATMFMTDLLQSLIRQGHTVQGLPIRGGWLEIDSHSDLHLAQQLTRTEGGQLVWT